MKKMARYLDDLLQKWQNPTKNMKELEENEDTLTKEDSIVIDYGDKQDNSKKKRDFVEENRMFFSLIFLAFFQFLRFFPKEI